MLTLTADSRLPLSRYPRVYTRDVDEAVDIYSRMMTPVRLQGSLGKADFSWRAHQLSLGPLSLAANEYTASMKVESESASDVYMLSIPLAEASAEATIGKLVTPLVRGRSGLLCAPKQGTTIHLRGGYRGLHLSLPKQAISDAMRTLTGREARELKFERSFALDTPQVVPFLQLLAYLVKQAEHESPEFVTPDASERLAEALLFRLLLSQPHSQSALLVARPAPAAPRHVRRGAEYLDTHFARAVTMAELTRVTGVSARSLQAGFQQHLGCSPLGFVRERRLQQARVLLLTSDSVDTVSEVAQRVGIGHLGRFSMRYRKRFGENPTHTLARCWGRAR